MDQRACLHAGSAACTTASVESAKIWVARLHFRHHEHFASVAASTAPAATAKTPETTVATAPAYRTATNVAAAAIRLAPASVSCTGTATVIATTREPTAASASTAFKADEEHVYLPLALDHPASTTVAASAAASHPSA